MSNQQRIDNINKRLQQIKDDAINMTKSDFEFYNEFDNDDYENEMQLLDFEKVDLDEIKSSYLFNEIHLIPILLEFYNEPSIEEFDEYKGKWFTRSSFTDNEKVFVKFGFDDTICYDELSPKLKNVFTKGINCYYNEYNKTRISKCNCGKYKREGYKFCNNKCEYEKICEYCNDSYEGFMSCNGECRQLLFLLRNLTENKCLTCKKPCKTFDYCFDHKPMVTRQNTENKCLTCKKPCKTYKYCFSHNPGVKARSVSDFD